MTSKKQGWDFGQQNYTVKRTLQRRNQVNPYSYKSILGSANSMKPQQRHMRYKGDVNPLRMEGDEGPIEPTPSRKVELLKKYYKEKLVEITNAAYAIDPLTRAPVGYRQWINKQVDKGRIKQVPAAGSKEDNSFRLRYVSLLETKASAYGQIIAQLSASGGPEQVLDTYLRGFHSFLRGRPTEAAQAKLKRLGMNPTFEPFRDESVQQYLKAFSRVKKEYYEDLAMLRMNGPTGGIRNIELYYKYIIDGAEDEKIEKNLWHWLEGGKLSKYGERIAGGSHDSLVNQLSAEFPVSGSTSAIPPRRGPPPATGRPGGGNGGGRGDDDDDDRGDGGPGQPPQPEPSAPPENEMPDYTAPPAPQQAQPEPGSAVAQPGQKVYTDEEARAKIFTRLYQNRNGDVLDQYDARYLKNDKWRTDYPDVAAHLGKVMDKFRGIRAVERAVAEIKRKREANDATWINFDAEAMRQQMQSSVDAEADLTDEQKAMVAELADNTWREVHALDQARGAAPSPAAVAGAPDTKEEPEVVPAALQPKVARDKGKEKADDEKPKVTGKRDLDGKDKAQPAAKTRAVQSKMQEDEVNRAREQANMLAEELQRLRVDTDAKERRANEAAAQVDVLRKQLAQEREEYLARHKELEGKTDEERRKAMAADAQLQESVLALRQAKKEKEDLRREAQEAINNYGEHANRVINEEAAARRRAEQERDTNRLALEQTALGRQREREEMERRSTEALESKDKAYQQVIGHLVQHGNRLYAAEQQKNAVLGNVLRNAQQNLGNALSAGRELEQANQQLAQLAHGALAAYHDSLNRAWNMAQAFAQHNNMQQAQIQGLTSTVQRITNGEVGLDALPQIGAPEQRQQLLLTLEDARTQRNNQLVTVGHQMQQQGAALQQAAATSTALIPYEERAQIAEAGRALVQANDTITGFVSQLNNGRRFASQFDAELIQRAVDSHLAQHSGVLRRYQVQTPRITAIEEVDNNGAQHVTTTTTPTSTEEVEDDEEEMLGSETENEYSDDEPTDYEDEEEEIKALTVRRR